MSLSPDEEKEYCHLLRTCGLTLAYPQHYKYRADEDCYEEINDKHEWHEGVDVRRLRELANKITGEVKHA